MIAAAMVFFEPVTHAAEDKVGLWEKQLSVRGENAL